MKTEWIELRLRPDDADNIELLTRRFPAGGAARGLKWGNPQFEYSAVGWAHVPTGNLVLVEAQGESAAWGTVVARLWIAATDATIFLTDSRERKYDQGVSGAEPEDTPNLKLAMEWACTIAMVELDLPQPQLLRSREAQ